MPEYVKISFGSLFLLALLSGCFKKENKQEEKKESNRSYDIKTVLTQENVLPLAIIGSGPAGLSAALYGARSGLKSLVLAGPMPCGQLTQTTYIENWPGREKIFGATLMEDMKKQAESFGTHIVYDSVTQLNLNTWPFEITTDDGREFKAMAIVVATGASPKRLNIPNEQEYWGKGVTTCAICDATFFKGKNVVIAGGGDSAIEMASELVPYVQTATILVRKSEFRASKAMQERLPLYPNVKVEFNKEITHIYGDQEKVTGIDIFDNRTNTTEKRDMDGVFLAIGHDPNNKLLKNKIELDEHGYAVMTGRTQQTSIRGVFAAGEIQDPSYRQAIVAAGEGVKAALDALSFLHEIGINQAIAEKIDQNFFEHFSDEKMEIPEIETLEEFNDQVINRKGITFIDYYHTVCPSCIKMLPVIEAVAHKMQEQVNFIKINYDRTKKTIFKELYFNFDVKIKSLPSFIIFKDGKPLDMTTKLMSKRELAAYIQSFLTE